MSAEKKMIVEDIEGDEVVLDDAGRVTKVTQRVETPPKPKQVANGRDMTGWKAIIMEDNDSIPPPGLYIGYNGQTYLLRAGVTAKVPPGILEILNNAVVTVPVKDPNTLQVTGWRDKLRYPYRVVMDRVQAA